MTHDEGTWSTHGVVKMKAINVIVSETTVTNI